MNIWRRGSLAQNPYSRTAFRVGRVPREVTSRSMLVQHIGQTRAMVSTDPQSHGIQGKSVTQEEVNAAEAVLLSAEQRVLEELLVHATERPQLGRIRRLLKEAAETMMFSQDSSWRINPEALRPILLDLVKLYLLQAKGAQPSLGALELELVPPFGGMEGE